MEIYYVSAYYKLLNKRMSTRYDASERQAALDAVDVLSKDTQFEAVRFEPKTV